MPKVHFQPADKTVTVAAGTLISEAAHDAGVPLNVPCGGQGRCGRCVVRIGGAGQPGEREVLACQTPIHRDLTVTLPPQTIERKLDTDKTARAVDVPLAYDAARDQPLRAYPVLIVPPSLDDQTDDWSRLKRALGQAHGALDVTALTAELPVVQRLAGALRASCAPEGGEDGLPPCPEWEVTAIVEGGTEDGPPRLIEVVPGRDGALYGVAIDIGTTTNVVWLVNLRTGAVVAQAADYNGQVARGEDVISRIIYASKGEGLAELQGLVRETLNRLIADVAEQAGIAPQEIYRAVVAGNSTMLHLFAGLPPETIRRMPFITTINQLPPLRAHTLGLAICPDATVDCLPGVASYVGADITAGVLSSGMCASGDLTLFIDIGTNGEIVLGDGTWLITCACSAGPAFEGGGVAHGMRATRGAIEEVWINQHTYEPTLRVIGPPGTPPRGLCGSGLIGLLAEMFITGVVDKSGNVNLSLPTDRTREGAHGGEYVVAWADDVVSRAGSAGRTNGARDIVLTNVDIDNLMRAKAAIYAGFSVLARSVGLTIADVAHVLIGGAFGQYISIEKAIAIGLLPDAPADSFHYLGNTSVRGAYLALLARENRAQVAQYARMMTYLELSADNIFFDEFNAALFLPHTDTTQFPTVEKVLERFKNDE